MKPIYYYRVIFIIFRRERGCDVKKVIECVPNISEGRDTGKVQAIAGVIDRSGVKLLDLSSDPDHNRTVLTFAGEPQAVAEAAFDVARAAVEKIDLNHHQGKHPRMGAVDVIPFVPVSGFSMKECSDLAEQVGERIGTELNVPVYLYAESARVPQRRKLPVIREGEFEGFALKIKDPAWKPDFGPVERHPTAGCVAVGARAFLVAFNIDLSTDDVKIAGKIARSIRESSGGLVNLQAKGIYLEDRQRAQVSMNILDFRTTPIYRVFELVKMEAARYGVGIVESELIGLAPVQAFMDVASYYLQLPGLSRDALIETRIYE
jgi:glutamate formiminotransferase